MAKLWQKDYELDAFVEQGSPLDGILNWISTSSRRIAWLVYHFATMLEKIGILTTEELTALKEGLTAIIRAHENEAFPITRNDEDGHTAIENALTKKYGAAGKRIHTDRSRNDQVIVATRLYARAFLLVLLEHGLTLVENPVGFCRPTPKGPDAGTDPLQIAMPSSVGLWAGLTRSNCWTISSW